MPQPPQFLPMMEPLIATPSVSSTDPMLDMGDRAAAVPVADWPDATGFKTELMPIPGDRDKVNVIGALGRVRAHWSQQMDTRRGTR